MKISSDLFDLIKSLGKAEKRYIKLSLSIQKGEKEYLKLFDVMDGMEIYDEHFIRHTYRKEPFAKRLHAVKNYLYGLILKSLRGYYAGKSVDARIQCLLQDSGVLYTKALYRQCSNTVNKAIALAAKYQRLPLLAEAMAWKRRIITTESFVGLTASDIDKLIAREQSVLDALKNSSEYWKISFGMLIMLRKKADVQTPGEVKKLDSLLQSPFMKSESRALSMEAKGHFNYICSTYYYAKGNYRKAYFYAAKLVRLLQKEPALIIAEPNKYIDTLNNLSVLQVNLKQYDDSLKTIAEIRNVPGKYFSDPSEDLHVRVFTRSVELESNLYIITGKFKEGIGMVDQIRYGLDTYGHKLGLEYVLIFYFRIAYMFFGGGQYHKSSEWLNKILTMPPVDLRTDILVLSHILNLMVHYELGHTDILGYLIKSAYRSMDKAGKVHHFEKTLLRFFGETLSENPSGGDLVKAFGTLRRQVEKIVPAFYRKRTFEHFDIIAWLDSKIQNRPFEELVREKAGK